MIEAHSTPQLVPDLIWRVLDDNAVVISPSDGKVQVLNGTGSAIWQLLAEGRTLNEIEGQLIARYSVSEEQAARDVQSFVTELVERGLLLPQSA